MYKYTIRDREYERERERERERLRATITSKIVIPRRYKYGMPYSRIDKSEVSIDRSVDDANDDNDDHHRRERNNNMI